MNSVRKPVVFTCLEILSHFLASVVQCQLHWHITTSSSVNCLENFKYNRTWRLSCYIVQHFWARTSTSLWNNRKEKQSLTISSLQCAVWGSCPHVENVQESANWKFWKPFRKKWLYTYIHAWCVCLYSLYKEFCLFPGLTHQLTTNQCSCSYTQMRGSCLALFVEQHSQLSVCMTVRKEAWEKVSALLQKLVGISICSPWSSVLLPVLWDKYT